MNPRERGPRKNNIPAVTFLSCCVKGCKNNTRYAVGHNLTMFRFPRSKIRRAHWVEIIGRPELKGKLRPRHRVCEAHFDVNMRYKDELTPTAFPNINLPVLMNDTPSPVSYPNVGIQSCSRDMKIKEEPVDSLNIDTPSCSRDMEIKKEPENSQDVLELEKEIAEMESSTITLLKKCKTGRVRFGRSKFMDIYEAWHNQMKANYHGMDYKKMYISHCLNLYCKAPQAYPIFKRTFSLPSIKKLKNIKLNIPPGTHHSFMDLIGRQLRCIPNSKHVILCIEEISLFKHLYYDIRHDEVIGFLDFDGEKRIEGADTAYVISIKGCSTNYQQMIGYCLANKDFSDRHFSSWLDYTILSLFDVGLEVCAVLSKHTQRFESLAIYKGVSVHDPSFKVEDKIVYYLFDLKQMINSVRDCLILCDFLYDGNIVSWNHLNILYQTEMDRRIRLVPKLTDDHLNPYGAKRQQLQLTREVFSENVAAVMSAEIEESRLPLEAQGTVDFFLKMNDVINICSSTTVKHRNPHKRAYTAADDQIARLSKALMVFEDIQVINRITREDLTETTKTTTCFRGLIVSIKAIVQMYEEYHSRGLKHLRTKRFHLESEEMLSNHICKRTSRVTAIKVKRSFSALALSHLIKNSSLVIYKGFLDRLLLTDEDTNDFILLKRYLANAPKSSLVAIGTTDYRFEFTSDNTFQEIFLYVFDKCLKVHNCNLFKEYIDKAERLNLSNNTARIFKLHYGKVFPPEDFIACVQQCDKIFIRDFDVAVLKPNLGTTLFQKIQVLTRYKPCPCFPTDYLIKLFLRIRIYNIMKFRNLRLRSAGQISKMLMNKI